MSSCSLISGDGEGEGGGGVGRRGDKNDHKVTGNGTDKIPEMPGIFHGF